MEIMKEGDIGKVVQKGLFNRILNNKDPSI